MGTHQRGRSGRRYGDGLGTGYKNPPGPKWEQGQSGNPNGAAGRAPPRLSANDELLQTIQNLLATKRDLGGEQRSLLEGIIISVLSASTKDWKPAFKLLELVERLQRGSTSIRDLDEDDISEDEALILAAAQSTPPSHTLDETNDDPDVGREAGGDENDG